MDIVEKKFVDLFEVVYENVKVENVDMIKMCYILIIKGFRNSMNFFRVVIEDEGVEIELIRKYVFKKIFGDRLFEEDVVNEFLIIVGIFFVFIGRVIKVFYLEIKNVYLEYIEEVKKVLDYML